MPVEKSPQTIFTPLDDGTGVLLNLETRLYYSLNRTGVAIWQEIGRGITPTVDDLVVAVCKRFSIDEDGARQATVDFVSQLVEFKMVRVVE